MEPKTIGAKPGSVPWRNLAREGLVRVREYHCTACAGDPPQDEQFAGPSIAIVRSGVFGIRTDRRTHLLSTGFVLLGNAKQAYEASHEHGVGDQCLVFEFQETTMDRIVDASRRGAGLQPFARNVLPPLSRVDALRQLVDEELIANNRAGTKTGAPDRDDANMRFEELGLSLAEYVLSLAGGGTPRPIRTLRDDRRARDAVHTAISHIESAFEKPLGLTDLATAAGLDAMHFLRLFKRETGTTPYRFLVQARLRRAVTLLRDTSLPVTRIAFDVGFGDLSNFINAFRREIGVSPRRYRRDGLPRVAGS